MALKAPPFDEAVKQEIQRKFVQLTGGKCPLGGHTNWIVMDGYSRIHLAPTAEAIALGGPGVPCATLVCAECGFVAEMALGVLGILKDVP
jgi:hypothetical protein